MTLVKSQKFQEYKKLIATHLNWLQYFHQAAILLLNHDESGSYGIILNRPSDYRMGQLQLSKDLLGLFDACRLHVGGDVGDSSLQILHAVPGLQGESRNGILVGTWV